MKFSNIERFLRLQKLRPPTRSPSTHIVPGKRALAKRALALTTSLSLTLASVPFLPTTASAWVEGSVITVNANGGMFVENSTRFSEVISEEVDRGSDYKTRLLLTDYCLISEYPVKWFSEQPDGFGQVFTPTGEVGYYGHGFVFTPPPTKDTIYACYDKSSGYEPWFVARDTRGDLSSESKTGCVCVKGQEKWFFPFNEENKVLYDKKLFKRYSHESEKAEPVFNGIRDYRDYRPRTDNSITYYEITESLTGKTVGSVSGLEVLEKATNYGEHWHDEFFIFKDNTRLIDTTVNGRLGVSKDAKVELFNVNVKDVPIPITCDLDRYLFYWLQGVSTHDSVGPIGSVYWSVPITSVDNPEFSSNTTIYSGTFGFGLEADPQNLFKVGKGGIPKTITKNVKYQDRLSPVNVITRIDNIYGSWEDLNPKPQPPAPPADTAPPQITVTRTPSSPDTPASSVTLWIECKDPQGNDIAKPLSIDNGAPVATPFTMRVTENKRISVKATDSYGNFYETIVEVRNIDKSAPVVNSLNPSTTDFTKDNVTITASATDDCKLDSQGYYWSFTPFDPSGNRISETASSSSSFTVTENGTVSLRVKDSMGNMSTAKTFAVRNIDKTPPRITNISVSPDAHANPRDGVLVTVTVEDTPDASGVTSGLNDTPIMWDSTWGKTERIINNNGVVTVRARDKLGNLSEPKTVSIDFIDSSLPYIGSITPDKTGQFVSSPVTYTVEAFNADGTKLTGKAYSWDDGDTWLSNNKKVITENGEYKLTVKSLAGNTATQTITVSNVDNVKPSVDMRLVKESRTTQGGRPKDVWVLKIEAKDSGSGIDYIETNWDGKKIKDSYFQADVTKPGLYSVMAVDKAGNSTSNEKYITAEMIGSNKEDDKNTDITIDTKPQDGSDLTESGLKSEFADPNNLIYGETGIYNKVTKNFSTYADANYPGAGIAVAARVEPMENSYVSGTMSLEGVNYPMKFNKWNSDVKTKLEGDFLYGFIPYNALKSDIKNQRLKIQVFEHEDEKGKTLVRDGSAVVYVSAQISDPVIRYSYNKADQLLTIVPTSTVAGVKSTKYSYDGGSPQEYTAPFICEKNNKINITVTDNVQNTQTLALTGSDLGLEGGTGSLPTEGLNPNSNVKSYRSSSRTSDSYLINGNQSNTDVIPSKEVFELFE